jgi:hypothetical protein
MPSLMSEPPRWALLVTPIPTSPEMVPLMSLVIDPVTTDAVPFRLMPVVPEEPAPTSSEPELVIEPLRVAPAPGEVGGTPKFPVPILMFT